MAKVKVASRNTGRRSAKKSNTTSPTRTTAGKIQKNRPSFKGEKAANAKQNNYINKCLDIQSKTRLCFVNIKRDNSILNILNSSSKDNNCVNNNSGVTLQAQCEYAVDNNNHKNHSHKEGVEVLEVSVTKPRTMVKTRGSRGRKQTNDVQPSPKDESENMEISLGGKASYSDFHTADKEDKDKSDSHMSPAKLSNNLDLSVHNMTPRRCNVRIKRVNAVYKKQKRSTRSTDLSEKKIDETRPHTVTRKCRVMLRKSPMVPKSIPTEELYAIAELEDEMMSLSRSQISNPALDQEKRDSLRKLALPKTKPLPATIETDNNKNKTAVIHKDKVSKKSALPKEAEQRSAANNTIKRIHFVPQRNSTMHFELIQNSTAIEFNEIETNNNTKIRTEAAKGNLTEDNPSSPILKSIENLPTISSSTNNKTHKFFHRHETESVPENQKSREPLPVTNKNGISKNKRLLTKRSSEVRREKVYDFLSQSQSSDSEVGKGIKAVDPMADIIKKLIDQGKVAVATNRKGKGRPKLKANRPRKINKATKQTAAKRTCKNKAKANKVQNQQGNNVSDEGKISADDHDNFDHFLDDDLDADVDYNMNKPLEPIKKGLQHHVTDQEGTFSKLAKSVLISQAGRTDPQRVKAQRLLAMAKKLISTPLNKKTPSPQTALNADFSPIVMSTNRPATRPSPWRVDEDAHLPSVFNFSRSSGNLPSFSSDFIPSTPTKEKPKRNPYQMLGEMPADQNQQPQSSPLSGIEGVANIPSPAWTPLTENQNLSVPSSFSSNDSNAENNPPPKSGPDKATDNNANIFDLKQLPNPRRALSYRSPLKAINILEVVHLPPIQNLKSGISKEKTQTEMFGFEDISESSNTFKTPLTPSSKKKSKKNSPEMDLFGFEEFLSQTDHSSQESLAEEPNTTIQDKLHSLRRLRPDSSELEINLQQTKNSLKVPNLFNEPAYASKPQKSIKEMLCSTMIEQQPSTSKKALEELKLRNLGEKRHFNCTENGNISELFKDPEPETTFNEEDPHRTYVRPYKRKRRLRENKLVYVYESDVSGDEHESSTEKNKKALQRSHETDTSSEQPPTKKKRQYKEKPELKNFVEEFKEMCKEVECYKLIVEKSA